MRGGHVLIVLRFSDISTFVGHFVSSPREREKRDRKDSSMGIKMFILTKKTICGATMAPILAEKEHEPTPIFLTTVGNSSAEKTCRAAQPPDIPALPTIAKTTVRLDNSSSFPVNKNTNTCTLFTVCIRTQA